MTPHREWFKSYTPCNVPIQVANGQVIYAAGVGTVEFTPVSDGHTLDSVLFSGHVPDLNQNLLSVLTLTSKHAFQVVIESDSLKFVRDGIPRFYTSVGADRVALLSGSTVVQPQMASPAQAVGYHLWHHHFGHISLGASQNPGGAQSCLRSGAPHCPLFCASLPCLHGWKADQTSFSPGSLLPPLPPSGASPF
jgi:Pol polyprotein, beta-barrel domain